MGLGSIRWWLAGCVQAAEGEVTGMLAVSQRPRDWYIVYSKVCYCFYFLEFFIALRFLQSLLSSLKVSSLRFRKPTFAHLDRPKERSNECNTQCVILLGSNGVRHQDFKFWSRGTRQNEPFEETRKIIMSFRHISHGITATRHLRIVEQKQRRSET